MNIEDKIKETARMHAHLPKDFDMGEELYYNSHAVNAYESFQEAVKSDVAKEYWQKGMYTKEQVQQLINSFADYHKIDWLSPITRAWIKHNDL